VVLAVRRPDWRPYGAVVSGFPDARSSIAVHHPSKRTGLACSLLKKARETGVMGLMRLMHAIGAKLGEIHPFALARELGTVIPTQY